jgi:hypothetical protein
VPTLILLSTNHHSTIDPDRLDPERIVSGRTEMRRFTIWFGLAVVVSCLAGCGSPEGTVAEDKLAGQARDKSAPSSAPSPASTTNSATPAADNASSERNADSSAPAAATNQATAGSPARSSVAREEQADKASAPGEATGAPDGESSNLGDVIGSVGRVLGINESEENAADSSEGKEKRGSVFRSFGRAFVKGFEGAAQGEKHEDDDPSE